MARSRPSEPAVGASAPPHKADQIEGAARGPLMTQSGHSALLTNVVADDAAGEADQDRREGGQPWQVRHLSACRGGDSTAAVRRNPGTDRRPATTARADMTPCVIAAAGANRRVPGSRHLPNARLQIPDCTLAGSPTHRAPYLKAPIWIVGSRFGSIRIRSIRNCATVFGAWEEPSWKSRLSGDVDRLRLRT